MLQLSRSDFAARLKRFGLPYHDEYVEILFQKYDVDNNGWIDGEEFEVLAKDEVRLFTKAFKEFDLDGDHQIDLDEIYIGLGKYCSNERQQRIMADEIMKKADISGDGLISYLEFSEVFALRSNFLDEQFEVPLSKDTLSILFYSHQYLK